MCFVHETGRVLLPTDCPTSNSYLKGVNPSYYKAKPRANSQNKKNQDNDSKILSEVVDAQIKERENHDEFYKKLFYNYFKEPPEYTAKEVSKLEPYSDKAWVHSCCAYWVPGVEMDGERNVLTGIEHVDLRRFNMICRICGQSRLR